MPTYSFFGSHAKGVSQDSLVSKITEVFKINIIPDSGRDATINSLMKKDALEVDEVAVYCKEDKSIVLFFNSQIETDWMEVIAVSDSSKLSNYGIGQFDTLFSKGSVKLIQNGYELFHITKFSDVIKFPLSPHFVPQEEEAGDIAYWIDDIGMDAMRVRLKKKLFQFDNGNTAIKIFRFYNSSSFFKELEKNLILNVKIKREEKLKHFREFVALRSNVGAAFESNKYDKVIYQFLSEDYVLPEHLKNSYYEVGKYHNRESLIDLLINGEDAEVINKIEELAQNNLKFFGLFDIVFYIGLYHTNEKVRANALALALLVSNWDAKHNFWHLWKKDFYAKKIMLPYDPSHEYAQSYLGMYITQLLQYKYLPEENKGAKTIMFHDVGGYRFDGPLLKYFDEVIIDRNHKLVEDEQHFFTSLGYFGKTIKSLAITNSSLKYIFPHFEKIPMTKLDISDNPIESIDYLKFDKLEELVMRNTAIKSLSLNDLPALKKIVLDNLAELDNLHLVDIGKLNKDFYFEVSKKEGAKTYFNFKKQEVDPFKAPASKPFWKVW